MKLLQRFASLTVALLFCTSTLAADAKPVGWLFVHTAKSAEMTRDKTLVMPVTRDILAFTDRPNRLHGYLNAHEFVSMWKGKGDTFRGDPPNAVLTWVTDMTIKEAQVVVANATVTDDGRSISYEVAFEAGDYLKSSMDGVSLFIEGLIPPPNY